MIFFSKTKIISIFIFLTAVCYQNNKAQILAASEDTSKNALVLIKTSLGNITLRLSNQTPLHRDNFLKLIKKHFYDSLLFHRVINGFMIQGGDPLSKHAKPFVLLGDSDNHYTVPAEFTPHLFHQRGMLCAARDGDEVNPQKASSGCQFYITQGRGALSDRDLLLYEHRINKKIRNHLKDSLLQTPELASVLQKQQEYKKNKNNDSLLLLDKMLDEKISLIYAHTPHYTFSTQQIQTYKKIGGTPHLDNNYTVFGEVINGMAIVDKIAQAETDSHDRPLENIRMEIRLLRDYTP
ncbi:MAG: peptidylprolyl isomerase [Bacteroidetes bacterium]|nr:peptidylprolyl isomerase [Bacteroidota bacterium]